jgi:hypothetical protein
VNPNNHLKLRIEPQTPNPLRGTVWFRLLSGKEVEWGLWDFARSSGLRDSPYIDPTKIYTMARRFWYFLKHLYSVEITVLGPGKLWKLHSDEEDSRKVFILELRQEPS